MFEEKEEIFKREKADPSEGDRPWPLSIWLLLVVMSSIAFGYLLVFTGDGTVGGGDLRTDALPFSGQLRSSETAKTAVEADPEVAFLEKGEQVYRSVCVACHQTTGTGLAGAFPPLDGSGWVTGPEETPVKIVLHGLMGPIKVKDVEYNGVMPGFGTQLSDEEVAAVASYVRNAWSNEASLVSAETVARIREASGTRGPWTADEL